MNFCVDPQSAVGVRHPVPFNLAPSRQPGTSNPRNPRWYQTGIRVHTDACTPTPVARSSTATTVRPRGTAWGTAVATVIPATREQARLSVTPRSRCTTAGYNPSTFGVIFSRPCSAAHRSNSTVARSSTSGTARPMTRKSTDFR